MAMIGRLHSRRIVADHDRLWKALNNGRGDFSYIAYVYCLVHREKMVTYSFGVQRQQKQLGFL
jgi:hypothetical protein